MAKKIQAVYEVRKISDKKWGIFLKNTDICYGVCVGKNSQSAIQRTCDRLNRSLEEEKNQKTNQKNKEEM
jgi:hypothetical protein